MPTTISMPAHSISEAEILIGILMITPIVKGNMRSSPLSSAVHPITTVAMAIVAVQSLNATGRIKRINWPVFAFIHIKCEKTAHFSLVQPLFMLKGSQSNT